MKSFMRQVQITQMYAVNLKQMCTAAMRHFLLNIPVKLNSS